MHFHEENVENVVGKNQEDTQFLTSLKLHRFQIFEKVGVKSNDLLY